MILIVLATLIQAVYADFRQRNSSRQTAKEEYYSVFDHQIGACTRPGNVFLTFQGYGPSTTALVNSMLYRTTYLLWPRRVVVRNPNDIHPANELIQETAAPNESWLQQHNVGTVISFVGTKVPADAYAREVDSGQIQASKPLPTSGADASISLHSALWCVVDLLIMAALGYPILRLITKRERRSPIEVVGNSIALGAGILALYLIAMSMLGYAPSRALITAAGVVGLTAVILHLALGRPKPQESIPSRQFGRVRPWLLIPLLVIGYAIVVVASDALLQTVQEWDASCIWQLKAKVLFNQTLRPQPDYFTTLTFNYSHLRYPILVPMLSASVDAASGQTEAILVKAPFLILFFALGAIVYGVIREDRDRTAAIVATALLLTLPVAMQCSGAGTADLALTTFACGSYAFLVRWIARQQWRDLIMTALFSALCLWTKNEGAAIAAANIIVLWIFAPRRFGARSLGIVAAFILMLAVAYLPWIIYTRNLPQTDEDYLHRITPANLYANFPKIAHVVPALARLLFDPRQWGAFWLLAPLLAVLGWPAARSRTLLVLWLLLLLHFITFIGVFIITPLGVDQLLADAGYRVLLHSAPLAALLIGFQWPASAAAICVSRRPSDTINAQLA